MFNVTNKKTGFFGGEVRGEKWGFTSYDVRITIGFQGGLYLLF